MALTPKQKKIIQKGISLRKSRRSETEKDIVDIIEEKITGQVLTSLVTAIKAELISRYGLRKDAIDEEITNISS